MKENRKANSSERNRGKQKMNEKILMQLSQITEEEQFLLVPDNRVPHRSLYAKPGRFLIERRHISGIVSGESTAAVCIRAHPRFREFPEHSHDFIEMMYVCSGSITHVFGTREVKVSTDHLILLGKEARHAIRTASKEDIGINLIISPDLFEVALAQIRRDSGLSTRRLEALLNRGADSYCVFDATENIPVRNLMENMLSSLTEQGKADSYLLQQSLILLLCYLAAIRDAEHTDTDDSYTEQMAKKIQNYIRTSYSTATLTEAAQMLGLSSPYLSRWICRHFGVNFKTLLMKERFAVAEELLSGSEMPIGDIIRHIGYENSSYFHKEFRKRYGMPPKSYRRFRQKQK